MQPSDTQVVIGLLMLYTLCIPYNDGLLKREFSNV